jgi:hypothetical protein
MSRRIAHILAVLGEVFRQFSSSEHYQPVMQLRIQAVHHVAEQAGVKPQTVQDAFVRRMRPHVANTSEFDQQLEAWLRYGGNDLLRTVLSCACNPDDEQRVQAFFTNHPGGGNRAFI